jgi:hypothetical protein
MYARRLVIASTDNAAPSTMKTRPSLSLKSNEVELSCRFCMLVVCKKAKEEK